MKLYRFLIITLAFTAIAVSCRDAEPNIPFNVFNHGAYARTINVASGTYNFFDLQNSAFTATIQIVDERDGDLLQSVDVYVRHRRGQTLSPEVLVKTLAASAFTKTPAAPQPGTATPTGREDGKAGRAYPTTTFSVSATEASGLTGPTLANIQGADAYEIRLVLNLTDGRSFTNTNSSADIQGGPFYASPFFYRASVVCPSNNLQGTYNYSATDMQSIYGSCPGTINGTVTLTALAGGNSYQVSDATFGFWNCYGDSWGNGNVRLNDACGALSFSGADKYGDSYAFNFISNNGTNLVFRWVNSSNEEGTVTLVANATPWPANLK
jgi:hypothetical protein